jgi:hypothetical protein
MIGKINDHAKPAFVFDGRNILDRSKMESGFVYQAIGSFFKDNCRFYNDIIVRVFSLYFITQNTRTAAFFLSF